MLTFPSRLKFKMSKNVKRRLGVIHIYNFNLFLLLPSVPMSQWARIVFKSLMESNQYLPLTACSPSLALISLQVSAGNSGIEPRGTNEQTHIAYFFMSVCEEVLQTKKWGKEVIKEEEETIKWQLYWYNYSCLFWGGSCGGQKTIWFEPRPDCFVQGFFIIYYCYCFC